jgi:predicted regulator of Ras-like GTPase activity (Roadblock/LC7/MglB family)
VSLDEAVGTDRLLGSTGGRDGPAEGSTWQKRMAQAVRGLFGRESVSVEDIARADALRLQGDLDEARELCAHFLEEMPGHASAHVVMGEILREQGEAAAAEAEWQQALSLHSRHPVANLRLAQLSLARGEIRHAMALLEISLLASPASPEAKLLLSLAAESELASSPAEQAGPRQPWLQPSRYQALLAAIHDCPSVAAAALAKPDGMVAGGDLGEAHEVKPAAGFAVTLLLESKPLLERIGAGQLRSVLVRGKTSDLQCFVVDGHVLLAAHARGAEASALRTEIQSAVAGLRRRWEEEGSHDAVIGTA